MADFELHKLKCVSLTWGMPLLESGFRFLAALDTSPVSLTL